MNPIQTGLRIKGIHQLTSLEKSNSGRDYWHSWIQEYLSLHLSILLPSVLTLFSEGSSLLSGKDGHKDLYNLHKTSAIDIVSVCFLLLLSSDVFLLFLLAGVCFSFFFFEGQSGAKAFFFFSKIFFF